MADMLYVKLSLVNLILLHVAFVDSMKKKTAEYNILQKLGKQKNVFFVDNHDRDYVHRQKILFCAVVGRSPPRWRRRPAKKCIKHKTLRAVVSMEVFFFLYVFIYSSSPQFRDCRTITE